MILLLCLYIVPMMHYILTKQLATFHQIGTPANWKSGEDVFIQPNIPTNTLGHMFPKVSATHIHTRHT
jgi:hypothetical protein